MENGNGGGYFVLTRVDLGQRVMGYELFHKGVNGGEVVGYTPRQVKDSIKGGEAVYGLKVSGDELVLDEQHGFCALMVKVGVGTLTSTDPAAVVNIMYTAYDREGDKFKVISSRFGHQSFCLDKVNALLELGAVNGVVTTKGGLLGAWELKDAAKAEKK